MKRKVFVVLLALLLTSLPLALASADPGYELTWWTVDDGGGQSTGGDFSLQGTTGQPDAGRMQSSGYNLSGGFWTWSPQPLYPLPDFFLPIVLRESR